MYEFIFIYLFISLIVSSSSTANLPVVAPSMINNSYSYSTLDALLTTQLNTHLIQRLQQLCSQSGMCTGTEYEFKTWILNYFQQKSLYTQHMDINLLSAPLSLLTPENELLNYMSYFDCGQLITDIDNINFFLNASNANNTSNTAATASSISKNNVLPSSAMFDINKISNNATNTNTTSTATATTTNKNYSTLLQLFEFLYTSHQTYNMSKQNIIQKLHRAHYPQQLKPNEAKESTSTIDSATADNKTTTTTISTNTNVLLPKQQDYAGLKRHAPDVYSRMSNPFLLMNEVAAIHFSQVLIP